MAFSRKYFMYKQACILKLVNDTYSLHFLFLILANLYMSAYMLFYHALAFIQVHIVT